MSNKININKIQGVVVAHSVKKFSIVQIRDGAKIQSFYLRDADVCYCESHEPIPGQIVLFDISPKQPRNAGDFPIAIRAEVFLSLESMASVLETRKVVADTLAGLIPTTASTEIR
jgi:hypothetical protein